MEILDKVKALLPAKVISRVELEGSEIIAYTKDREFFRTHESTVRDVAMEIKKRIEVRPEKDLTMDQDAAKKTIKELVPEDAKIDEIYFEPERSLVIIAAEKPGLVIGHSGETFRKIRSETFWVPRIERVPAIHSDVVMGIRKMVHKEVDFRKKFLNQVGENIFGEKKAKRDWIRVIGLGGWNEVGRSCTLVETPKSKVLIDCGVKAGAQGSEVYPIFNTKEFDYNELDAIIISHSHLDHCGAVPILYEYGYTGPVYMTTPALDLATLLWLDYTDVMQKGTTTPLFTAHGVKEAVKHAITMDYGEVLDVAPDVRLTFQSAGHILGSSLVHLHIGEGLHNIVYAMDQKFGRTTLLDPAYTDFRRVETLFIESTYGGRDDIMPPRQEIERGFMEAIDRVMKRGGIVLIPSFSVERAQELMAILVEHGFDRPIYLDGMIWDANGIFTAYPEYLGRNVQREIFRGKDPFINPVFKRLTTSSERAKAREDKPCVIISTSGMMTGGPVIDHLKALGEDERNMLIFVGYQAEGTMGRRIQKGWTEIPMTEDGKSFTLNFKMEVYTADGLSAHSDKNQLLAFIGRLGARPERVICIHGDQKKTEELARSVSRIFKVEALAPKNLEAIRLK
ncbi:beta-CASP ribonuclease aCPSF1 [archaeon]|nr:MAG: beta-CASP ribonuclease aCPSF1 [archaeon]